MKILGYILFTLAVFGSFHLIDLFLHEESPKTLSNEAIKPDLLLANSRQYYSEHAQNRSLYQLKLAIESIRDIEQDMDEASREKVDEAIVRLETIMDEMGKEDFDIQQLNNASIRALNALTYAEIKVSEHFVESHESGKARLALKYGMLHVKNALMFSKGKKKDYEMRIYDEMDSLLENGDMANNEIILKLELMIEELDNLEGMPE